MQYFLTIHIGNLAIKLRIQKSRGKNKTKKRLSWPHLHSVLVWVPKKEQDSKKLLAAYLSYSQTGLNPSTEWLPVWLHHKIEGKKKD